jgi:hypothetical protein
LHRLSPARLALAGPPGRPLRFFRRRARACVRRWSGARSRAQRAVQGRRSGTRLAPKTAMSAVRMARPGQHSDMDPKCDNIIPWGVCCINERLRDGETATGTVVDSGDAGGAALGRWCEWMVRLVEVGGGAVARVGGAVAGEGRRTTGAVVYWHYEQTVGAHLRCPRARTRRCPPPPRPPYPRCRSRARPAEPRQPERRERHSERA